MNSDVMSFTVDMLLAVNNSKDPALINLGETEKMQAIADYQKFLLLAKTTKQSLVPTEQIDAVWHIHMLHPKAYYGDCMTYFGYILDHRPSDGTEKNKIALQSTFKKTVELWQKEFGTPYGQFMLYDGGCTAPEETEAKLQLVNAICDGSGGDCGDAPGGNGRITTGK